MKPLPVDWKTASPPQLSREIGIAHHSVLRFIASGELRAVNLASKRSSRPLFRVARKDWDAFLLARATAGSSPTAAASAMRLRKKPAVKQYV